MKAFLKVSGGILAIALPLLGCNQPTPTAPSASPSAAGPPAVTVSSAAMANVTPAVTFVGRVQAINTVNITARVAGFLEKQDFTEGQMVHSGDLLFVIEQDTYNAAVAQAEAAVAKAKATETNTSLQLRRAQELAKSNTVAQATVDQDIAAENAAKADVLAAEATLQQAQINLGYTEIRAPITARIGRALVTPGNFVGPTTGTLATIVSQDPMYVMFPVSSEQVLEYRQRQTRGNRKSSKLEVRIKLASGDEYPHVGTVNFMDIQVNPGTDTIAVRAEFPNPEGWLVPGQIVEVSIERAEPRRALVIPQAALQLDQSGPYVLVVGSDDRVHQQRVKTGALQGSNIVIEQGLKAGDRVIVQGLQKVRPNELVMPTEAAEAEL